MQKIVTVIAPLNQNDLANIDRTLELRYLLADTIEERGLGDIVNEGVGKGYVEVSFITKEGLQLKGNITSLLLSLGFTGNNKIYIENYEE